MCVANYSENAIFEAIHNICPALYRNFLLDFFVFDILGNRDIHPCLTGTDSDKRGSLEYFVRRLEKSSEFRCHTGCINTVRWNSNGSLCVSGSDDCLLGVFRPVPHYQQEAKLLKLII